jgi:hypothetical protein
MFRAGDIEGKTFDTEEGPLYAEAPLAQRTKALRQLREGIPFFNELYEEEGSLDEYAAFLAQALEEAPFEYVTIEMQEIACIIDEAKYYADFRRALECIGQTVDPATKPLFSGIAQFDELGRFPPARLLLNNLEAESDKDYWNHCRVCGAGMYEAGIGRAVPWEPVVENDE